MPYRVDVNGKKKALFNDKKILRAVFLHGDVHKALDNGFLRPGSQMTYI